MICRTWPELVSSGEALLREGSRERARAEEHFSTCSACAERAFLLDPSWAVRRLPEAPFSTSEIADLARDLGGTGRILDHALEMKNAAAPSRSWLRAAAVGALVVLSTAGGWLSLRSSAVRAPAAVVEAPGASGPAASSAPEVDSLEATEAGSVSLSVIGAVAPATARVYELGEDDFALVMVVHETLDL